MAPTFATYARSLLGHALSSDLTARSPDGNQNDASSLGPLTARSLLLGRDDANNGPDPEAGIVHPHDINNKFVFVLFGLIGAGFIILGIWFFFWARNGGFFFKENDWDDYKSTVLRRKGPNGTTLSGATTETDLGGGSVYKDIDDGSTEDATTVISGTTGITGGVSDVAGRERKRKRREQKEREKERRREERRRERDEKKRSGSHNRSSRRKVAEDGNVIDEHAEAEAEEYLRNYRHEKAARVGGINRESDASTWDGSTNPTESSRGGYTESSVTSELMGNQEERGTPTHSPEKPKKSGGIRKVYSTADKRDSRETARIRAEAKKLQERGRRAAASSAAAAASSSHHQRRDFSWQRHNVVDEDSALVEAPPSYDAVEEEEEHAAEGRVPGGWGAGSDIGSEVGTKSYHHVIPGLSSSSGVGSSDAGTSVAGGTDVRDYAAEKRRKRRSDRADRGERGERGERGDRGYRRER
ncbi:hypothetical protein VMCG_02892 [Cytospora schulzeri]|uniref:Endosomal spry domain-containing protein n=1 Tax=Cytospora schulzeri TaxID=448051 RepID=A0A423WZ08_9PEZI|nr:hypothetical protein VMCG_02892 [Valsa malicola]